MFDHRIVHPGDIEIHFKLQRMIVHGTTQRIVDLITVIRVICVESGLNVPGRPYDSLDRSVKVKDVIEHIVVAEYQRSSYDRRREKDSLANGRDGPDGKSDILCSMNIIGRSMSLKQIRLFLLKDRNPTLSFLTISFLYQ